MLQMVFVGHTDEESLDFSEEFRGKSSRKLPRIVILDITNITHPK